MTGYASFRHHRSSLFSDRAGHLRNLHSFPTRRSSDLVAPSTISSRSRFVTGTSAVGTRKRSSGRSEEHTSELQSRLHLVCRLVLEKKNRGGAGQLSSTSEAELFRSVVFQA